MNRSLFVVIVDSYYGLWGAFTKSPTHGMWGIYVAKTRAEIVTEDLMGEELVGNKFFHPYLTYNARIDTDFSGTFSLQFDTTIAYTHHSRYLKNITLLGNNDTNVTVNELDNDITENKGINTVNFSGNVDDYEIVTAGNITTVRDKMVDRDGANTLKKIAYLQFANQKVDL